MLARLLRPLVALVLIGACSSTDEEPSRLPDATSTPGAESGSAGAIPEPGSTAAIEAEITAFFEDYIDTVNKSWTSKKALERRRTMFADTCSDCLAGYRFAKRAHDEDLILEAENGVVMVDLRVIAVDGDTITFITIEDSPHGELKDIHGDVVQEFDEYRKSKVINRAKRHRGSWLIMESRLR